MDPSRGGKASPLLNPPQAPRMVGRRNKLPIMAGILLLVGLLWGLGTFAYASMSGSPIAPYLCAINIKDAAPRTFDLELLKGLYYLKDENDVESAKRHCGKVLVRSMLPEKSRIIPPGSMVTMDFVDDRLNVYIDDSQIVTKAKYG